LSDVKELVIISGKGGTGKTSLVACLASLFKESVVADCDVDAANLDLLLEGKAIEKKEFIGGSKAVINTGLCTGCGTCREVCRFDAISQEFVVDRVACEGCGACARFCPVGAVDFSPRLCGECFICRDRNGSPFVFAELLPGEENSGKLVTMVRTEAREQADFCGLPLIIIDGPPGIGCPVISSVTGTRYAVIVTEPTGSGIHDMERVVELTRHFGIRTGVVINKSDINREHTERIRALCGNAALTFLGGIPFEPRISEAQRRVKTILEYAPDSPASQAVRDISKKIQKNMEEV
jgi:MinD superfamily P-loop ATPase